MKNNAITFLGVAILILAGVLIGFVYELVTFKNEINDRADKIESALVLFNTELQNFSSEYGDDIKDGLSQEAGVLKEEASVFADSLRAKTIDYLESLNFNKK